METQNSLTSQIATARQTAHVLYAEVQKARTAMQDTTLTRAALNVPLIPPQRYLRQYNTLHGHRSKIAQVRWSANSTRLVSACQDGFMIVWDPVTALKHQAIQLESPWVLLCAYSPSGRLVASAGLDNRCTVHRVSEDKPGSADSFELRGLGRTLARVHTAYISAVEFVGDSSVLTALGDMTIVVSDMEKDAKVREFNDHSADVLLLLVAPKERSAPQLFLSAGADGCVKVWDMRMPTPAQSCAVLKSDVGCLAQLADGYSFVSGSDDGLCKLFDLRSSCELEVYNLRTQFESGPGDTSPTSGRSVRSLFDAPGVVSLDVSRSGRILYACYADYGCIAWDLLRNDIVELIGVGSGSHTSRISQVSVSPDGQGLATASWDATIKVWST